MLKNKQTKKGVISYSTPTSAGILKLHAAVETLGGVRRFQYVAYVSSEAAAINVKLICVAMRASNKGRTLLLITDGPCEMSHCAAAAVFRPECDGHMPFLTYVLYVSVSFASSDSRSLELDDLVFR